MPIDAQDAGWGSARLGIGIAGLGAVGLAIARGLPRGLAGLKLVGVSARRHDVAASRLAENHLSVPVLPMRSLAEQCDVVVECAPAAAFRSIAEPAIAA